MYRNVKLFIILIFASMVLIMREVIINPPTPINFIHVSYDEFNKLGYQASDIKLLEAILSKKQFDSIIEKKISREVLFSYIKFDTFLFDEINEYEKIRTSNNVSYQVALNLKHHPHLMSHFYKQKRAAINIDNKLILVNKNYALSKDYIPGKLVYTKDINKLVENDLNRDLLDQDAYLALKNLFSDAEKNNIYLYLSNGYRSYKKQELLYNYYDFEIGNADLFSARPGHSEHQTGLAVDITSESVNFQLIEQFDKTKEGQYVRNNAHLHGFIIRYPKEKENITGYQYEPWHLRYVGVEAATIIYNNSLTLEEYLLNYTVMPK